jgi:medium-chain acyl-[acyl-carrier-protein] hydrolase
MGISTLKPNPWLMRLNPNPQARLRLFCLPYSGAGASIFTHWAKVLSPAIEVCAVQLPGRESRLAEPPFTSLEALVAALAPVLQPYCDRPFAFFGHSMGALISFDLARLLRREYGLLPVLLGVSGHRAAQLPDRHPPAHVLPDPELIAELRRLNGTPREVLDHLELLQLILPILRADFAVCETYAYTDDRPLECPIAAFGGLQDNDVGREEIEAWCEQTSSAFSLRMLPGDHFFLNTARPLLLQVLARELAQHVDIR